MWQELKGQKHLLRDTGGGIVRSPCIRHFNTLIAKAAAPRQQYAPQYPRQQQQSLPGEGYYQRRQGDPGQSPGPGQYPYDRDTVSGDEEEEYSRSQYDRPRQSSIQDPRFQPRTAQLQQPSEPQARAKAPAEQDWYPERQQRPRGRGFRESGPPTRQMDPVPRQSLTRYKAPRQLPRFSPPRGEEILAYNQVVNKEVISRGSGLSLGIISHFYTDPDTLSVVSSNLRPKGIFGSTPLQSKLGNVMLETFCQVGDVVLVHDESALDYTPGNGRYRGVPQDERAGLVNLVGCQICTSQGKSLGKVKSFSFSPDSGKIDSIQFDEIGLSWLLPALIGTWEIGVEYISLVDSTNALILLPGAEAKRSRVADGWLEVAFIGLQNIFTDNGIEQLSDVSYAEGVDEEWEAWRVKWAPYFLQHYNQLPPATRRDFDLFNKRYEQQSRFVQPKYLPPARDLPPEDPREMPQTAARRSTASTSYPTRQDPRLRRQSLQQSGSASRVAQQARQETASVQLFDQRKQPLQTYQARDADGGFGSPPEEMGYESLVSPGPQYDDWLEREQYREPLLRAQGRANLMSSAEPSYTEETRFMPQTRQQPASSYRQQAPNADPPSSDPRPPARERFETVNLASRAAGRIEAAVVDSETPAARQSPSAASGRDGQSAPRRTKAGPDSAQDIAEKLSGMTTPVQEELPVEEPLEQKDRDALWQEPVINPKTSPMSARGRGSSAGN